MIRGQREKEKKERRMGRKVRDKVQRANRERE